MKTSAYVREQIAKHEGLRLVAYPDPGTGGEPWTIGVGHAGGVKKGDKITHEQAMRLLADDLATAEAAVSGAVRVALNQNQLDALVSLVFNIGADAFRSSTLLRLLNMGDYRGAADQFPRWTRASGEILPGLKRRRDEERALFLS
nr:lysozyme [Variovorax boronicumulans]